MKERKQSYFKKVGSSLPKIIDKNIKEKNFVEISLIKKWREIIGDDIAKFCWPIKIVFSEINNLNGIIFLSAPFLKKIWDSPFNRPLWKFNFCIKFSFISYLLLIPYKYPSM